MCFYYSKLANLKILYKFIYRKLGCFSTIKSGETTFYIKKFSYILS